MEYGRELTEIESEDETANAAAGEATDPRIIYSTFQDPIGVKRIAEK